ncbi:antibiotic biosynthesis monooxygenase family protein [Halotia branconii]|uniref:Antibiotic biosynthesis monooxygenase n=1 Tax=Halotia branconii CENA392 TaxID=1539056 RepID=A0AAJ6NUI5_9CYAN|nr:antibiotic biosynthesis monooxygenase [Halotia branconii]WGV26852.1 antibiotic biosynthesis monooxygenase [Halotia branconii CENA392]
MAVTLINSFIVPENREAEFLKNWQKTAEVFSHTSGFIETHLHRNIGVGDGTFKFVNIARWESVEAWRSATENYSDEHSLSDIKAHPALYESIVNLQYQGEK